MDPISTIASLGRIINALYDQVQHIHHNKEQCQRLAERIHIVGVALQALKTKFTDQSVPPIYLTAALLDLKIGVLNAERMFNKLQAKSRWKQLQITVFAQTTSYYIVEIHRQLDQGLLQLNLGLSIQAVLEKEQREQLKKEEIEKLEEEERKKVEKEAQKALEVLKEARKKDMVKLLLTSYEAIEITEVNQDKKLWSLSQRKEVEEKQLASLQYNVDSYIKIKKQPKQKQKIQSQPNERRPVPFSDLIIEDLIVETPLGKLYYGRWRAQPVAIRMLEGNLAPEDIRGFRREAQAMQELNSEYILPIYAICEEPNRLCLITKYMEQGSLKQVLHKVDKKERELSLEQRHKLILEIARGLYYLHAEEFCHQNLRSEHVLIDADGHARIAEFRFSQNRMLSSLYEEGESVLEWMAPEIWMNSQSFTPEADIYSFGMIVWEIMTCKIPYASWDRTTLIDRIQKGEREELPSTVPKFYCDIIESCWQENPEDRPKLLQIITNLENYKVNKEAFHILTGSSSSFWKPEKSFKESTTPSIDSSLLPLISEADAEHFDKAEKICSNNFVLAAILSYRRTTLLDNKGQAPQPSETDAEYFAKAGKICFDKKEIGAAEVCYRQAVILGNQKAMNDLAFLHLTEIKTPESKVFAYQTLKLAANSGYAPAMINLAKQLEQGDGIKANPAEAAVWREKAKKSEPLSPSNRRMAKR